MMTNKQIETIVGAELVGLATAQHPEPRAALARLASTTGIAETELIPVLFESIAQIHDALFPPISQIELVYTEGCNLACTYCFERHMLGHRMMPIEVAIQGVDLLFRYSRQAPELSITHFGGEPTLNFKAVRTVTEYAESLAHDHCKAVHFSMTTNGTLIDDAIAEYCAAHGITILISLDGLKEANDRYRRDKMGRGTFDRVMAGLKRCQKYHDWVGVKMTIMPGNTSSMLEDVKLLHYEMGVNEFIIGYATGVEWPIEERCAYALNLKRVHKWYLQSRNDTLRITEFDEPGHSGKHFGCQAGRSSLSVTVDGQVSPCSKILAMDKKDLLCKLGDTTFGLFNIGNRIDLVSCGKLKAACAERGIASDYQGGCFATNYEETGDLFSPNMQDHDFSQRLKGACAGCAAVEASPQRYSLSPL